MKRFYRNSQARRGRQRLSTGEPGNGALALRRFPEPIREAFLHGVVTEAHLQEIARLPDEWVQLKMLARIKGYRLSVEQTRQFVDREVETSMRKHEEGVLS